MKTDANSKSFRGTFTTSTGTKIDVQLFVLLFVDESTHVAYCPAINVYGYGASEQEAKDSFATCLDEFFTYTLNKGTLFVELEHLGWSCKSKKRMKPPTLAALIANNSDMNDIWNHKNFTKFNTSVSIPSCC